MCKCSAASRHYTMIPNKTEHEGATLPSPIAVSIPILLRFRCQCKGGKRQNTRTASHPGKTMPVGSGQDWGQDKMGHRVVGMYDGFGGFRVASQCKNMGQNSSAICSENRIARAVFSNNAKSFPPMFSRRRTRVSRWVGSRLPWNNHPPFPSQLLQTKPSQAKPKRTEP